MENIHIEGTTQTPNVNLQTNGIMEFSGLSFPENTDIFYICILEWIDEYIKNPREETSISFHMLYFNNSTSKKFTEILQKIKYLFDNGFKVKVLWHHSADDEDMEEAGINFELLLKIPFTYIITEV